MDLLWPGYLLLLGLVPLLVAAYIWILRRRRQFAVRYSSLTLIREALPGQTWLKRHLPFVLFLLALTSLILALTRPVTIVSVPAGRATIILAMDVSGSMCASDIPPNRLFAAQEAALSFIHSQDSSTEIGIVAFGGYAEIIQPPTADQEVLEDVVLSLMTGRRTAIGSAILKSLDAIAEIDPNVAPSISEFSTEVAPTPVPNGAYAPAIIVLLTDGANNSGTWPLDAAEQAVDRGVRVYTIGFGTEQGGARSRSFCGQQVQGRGQSFGGGGGGGRFRRGIDEETLIQIAEMTGGTYYAPESADELQKVFKDLPTYLITKHETTEISVAFVIFGALMVALALVLSRLWHPLL
jgi:Ca-activated chloride channel family protein